MHKNTFMTLLAAGWLLAAAACDEDEPAEKPKPSEDAGGGDAGTKDDCVKSPKTGEEILNACTESDVESVDKKPDLPLLLKDGGLPPLP